MEAVLCSKVWKTGNDQKALSGIFHHSPQQAGIARLALCPFMTHGGKHLPICIYREKEKKKRLPPLCTQHTQNSTSLSPLSPQEIS